MNPHQHTPSSRSGIAAATVPSDPNPFAVHGDPSRRDTGSPGHDEENARRLKWVRPTDLYVDPRIARLAVRGVDLHAHLARIAWRQVGRGTATTARGVGHGVAGAARFATRPAPGAQGVTLS